MKTQALRLFSVLTFFLQDHSIPLTHGVQSGEV